jgi:hypothetical protein
VPLVISLPFHVLTLTMSYNSSSAKLHALLFLLFQLTSHHMSEMYLSLRVVFIFFSSSKFCRILKSPHSHSLVNVCMLCHLSILSVSSSNWNQARKQLLPKNKRLNC